MTAGLPLMKNILIPLAKNVFMLLEVSAAISSTDAAIQKRTYGSGTTALIIPNKKSGRKI